MSDETITCLTCGKPKSDFVTRSMCRECKNEKTRQHREKRKAEGRPYHQNGNSNRKRTLKQKRAHYLVRSAIEHGFLSPKSCCEKCGAGQNSPYDRMDAHHHDYDKPLEVIWLCRSCHIKTHASPTPFINADGPVDPEVFRLPNIKRKGSTNKFRGVSFRNRKKPYTATVTIPDGSRSGKKIHLGSFKTDVEAAKAYDEAAKDHFGEAARLNF